MTTRHSTTVAIVGAGASGTILTIQLLRWAESAGSLIDIRLIDPSATTGRGVAYSTDDDRHLLNVRASAVGAVASEADHFAGWLAGAKGITDPTAFVPRGWFGEYLEHSLHEAIGASRSRVERVAATVTDIHRREFDSTIRLDNGERFRASHVVLALGNPVGVNQLLPSSLLRSARFLGDPWAPGALARVAAGDGDVVILGTGLTMVDVAVAVSRPDRIVTAVSRRGLTPARHNRDLAARLPAPVVPSEVLTLEQVERLVADQVARATAAGVPWQNAIDSLRPVTNELWNRLAPEDQERFVGGPMRHWEVARHRMAPDAADALQHLIDEGQVKIQPGEVVDAIDDADGVDLRMADGTSLRASWVISCTGATSVRSDGGPLGDLVSNLEHQGAVVLHPLGMGLVIDELGRTRAAKGEVNPPIYVVGPLRRGRLWETTALPEILVQSDEVARHVVTETRRQVRRRPEDLYGEELTTTGAAADLYNEALGRLLRVQSGALEALQRSVEVDETFAMGHAALAVMGHEYDLAVDVGSHLEQAEHGLLRGATARERSFVHAIRRQVDGDSSHLIGHVVANPRDVLAVSVSMPTIAFSGAYDVPDDGWALLDRVAACYHHDWWMDGMLAFARQEQDRFDEARVLAEESLEKEPRGGHAAHAQAHVFFETGRHQAGLEWTDQWIATSGRDADYLAHFSWHAALFELALGDTQAVVNRLRSQMALGVVRGTRAMVDTATLVWRLRMEDEVCPIDASDLRRVAGEELWYPSTPFSAMHAVIAWAVIGDVEQLRQLEHRCRREGSTPTALLVAPLATGLRLFLTGRFDDAATVLVSLLPNLAPLGGSAAQRSIVEDTAVAALIRAGDGALAASILERRLARRARPKDLLIQEQARLATALQYDNERRPS